MKDAAFFENVVAEIVKRGFTHIGNFTAGSDRFHFHVSRYATARETMLSFTIPGKALMLVCSYHEGAYSDGSGQKSYWSFKVDFNWTPGKISSFMVETEAFDPCDTDDEMRFSWTEERFPMPKHFRENYSSSGSNHVTYAFESSVEPKDDDPIALIDLILSRNFKDTVEDGKIGLIWPELYSPYYSFPDCVDAFNDEFVEPQRKMLESLASKVQRPSKLSHRTTMYKLSNYIGDAA